LVGQGNLYNLGKLGTSIESSEITDDSIVNADINSSAAIALSKLAALTDGNILVGNGSNVAVSVNPTGDIDVTNAGVFSIASGVIVSGDLNSENFSNITGIGTQAQTLNMNDNQVSNINSAHANITTITSATSLTLDFDDDEEQLLPLAHNTTFASSNLGAGRHKTIHITSASAQTMAFPADWTFLGADAPTTTAAGKDSVLHMTSTTTADAGVKCVFAEET